MGSRVVCVVTSIAVVIAAAPASPQVRARPVPPGFVRLPDSAGRFTVDVPTRDWQTVSGLGMSLLTIIQKSGEALVAIEQTPLPVALGPDEMSDLFVELETDATRARNRDAT